MAQRDMSLVTLVTGSASGIGAATARLLATHGQGLVLHGRALEPEARGRLEATAGECRNAGAEVLVLEGDLANEGAGRALVQSAVAHFGRLDRIVSNAGFADKRPTTAITRGDLDRSFSTMAGAFLEIAQAAREALTASPQGRLVFVSSFVAHRYVVDGLFPASSAAKAAAEALVKSLAIELARSGVTVNAVAPGYTRKDHGTGTLGSAGWVKAAEITPNGRLAEPADVAHAIRFLLSAEARHITGQILAVDGGLCLGS